MLTRTISTLLTLSIFLYGCSKKVDKTAAYGLSYNDFRKHNGIYLLPHGYKPGFWSDKCLTFTALRVDDGFVLTQKLVFFKNDTWAGEEDHIAEYVNGKQVFMLIASDSLNNGVMKGEYFLLDEQGHKQPKSQAVAESIYKRLATESAPR